MTILILKILLAPILVWIASMLGKAFGPTVGGLVVGLPLTSGPIALIFAFEHGRAFAKAASLGILSGVISVVVFCLTYSYLCRRNNWLWSELVSITVYFITTFVMELWMPSLLYTSITVFTTLIIAIYLLHSDKIAHHAKISSPSWDLPVRMLVATVFVLLLTSAAQILGPHLSGLLAPFPIFVSVLVIFTHIFEGGYSARLLLYGALTGLFSFAIFFISIALFIQSIGTLLAFTAAVVSALVMQYILVIIKRYCGI